MWADPPGGRAEVRTRALASDGRSVQQTTASIRDDRLVMERLTNKLRLKENLFIKNWGKWLRFRENVSVMGPKDILTQTQTQAVPFSSVCFLFFCSKIHKKK